jgi:hypothetical protein
MSHTLGGLDPFIRGGQQPTTCSKHRNIPTLFYTHTVAPPNLTLPNPTPYLSRYWVRLFSSMPNAFPSLIYICQLRGLSPHILKSEPIHWTVQLDFSHHLPLHRLCAMVGKPGTDEMFYNILLEVDVLYMVHRNILPSLNQGFGCHDLDILICLEHHF